MSKVVIFKTNVIKKFEKKRTKKEKKVKINYGFPYK